MAAQYKLIDIEQDWYSVLIEDGPFEGVSYKYGAVQVRELEDSDQAVLQFDYEIINEVDYNKEQLEKDDDFVTTIGDILQEVIMHAIENNNYRIGTEEEK